MRLSLSLLLTAGLWSLTAIGRADISRDIVERGRKATVYIEIDDGSGSAFCIAPNGYFITNAHVVAGSSKVRVVLNSGDAAARVLLARVVRTNTDLGLALIKIEAEGLTALPLGATKDLYETLPVTTFGFPFGSDLT